MGSQADPGSERENKRAIVSPLGEFDMSEVHENRAVNSLKACAAQLTCQTCECVAPYVFDIADMNADVVTAGFDVIHIAYRYEVNTPRLFGDQT